MSVRPFGRQTKRRTSLPTLAHTGEAAQRSQIPFVLPQWSGLWPPPPRRQHSNAGTPDRSEVSKQQGRRTATRLEQTPHGQLKANATLLVYRHRTRERDNPPPPPLCDSRCEHVTGPRIDTSRSFLLRSVRLIHRLLFVDHEVLRPGFFGIRWVYGGNPAVPTGRSGVCTPFPPCPPRLACTAYSPSHDTTCRR